MFKVVEVIENMLYLINKLCIFCEIKFMLFVGIKLINKRWFLDLNILLL